MTEDLPVLESRTYPRSTLMTLRSVVRAVREERYHRLHKPVLGVILSLVTLPLIVTSSIHLTNYITSTFLPHVYHATIYSTQSNIIRGLVVAILIITQSFIFWTIFTKLWQANLYFLPVHKSVKKAEKGLENRESYIDFIDHNFANEYIAELLSTHENVPNSFRIKWLTQTKAVIIPTIIKNHKQQMVSIKILEDVEKDTFTINIYLIDSDTQTSMFAFTLKNG